MVREARSVETPIHGVLAPMLMFEPAQLGVLPTVPMPKNKSGVVPRS